jgi:dolichol kinase
MFIWITRYDDVAYYLLGFWAVSALLLDSLRNYNKGWNKIFSSIFENYLKPSEISGGLTGASTLWSGLYLLYLLFPRNVFYPAALVMVFSDTLAAIIGQKFPVRTFSNGKTVGGSAIFLISSMLIFRYANIPLILAFPLAIIVSGIEYLWRGSLENLAIGFGCAFSLSILEIL